MLLKRFLSLFSQFNTYWTNAIWGTVGEIFDISSGIRRRIVIWFILASALPLLFAIVFSFKSGFSSMQAALGANFGAVARQAAGQFEANVSREAQWMINVLLDDVLVEWVNHANLLYDSTNPRPLVEKLIQTRKEGYSQNEGIRDRILKNRISRRMRILSKARSGTAIFVTVTDQEGSLLAATFPTKRFDYKDSDWFQYFNRLQSPGIYFGIIQKENASFIELVRPIYNGLSISGALRTLIDFKSLFYSGGLISLGKSGEGVLVDLFKNNIYGASSKICNKLFPPPDKISLEKHVPHGWFFNPYGPSSFWKGIVGFSWAFGSVMEGGENVAYRWVVLVSQDPEETYLTAKDALLQGGIIGTIMVVILAFMGLFVARHIASPLLALRQGVADFARGRSELKVTVDSDDEISDLAKEFNRMAQVVRKTENRLQAFADAVHFSGDAILFSDIENRISYVNPAFETLTGYHKTEAIGKDQSLIASKETNQSIYQDMWITLQNNRPWRGEIINRRKNGTQYIADMIISPILDQEGSKLGYMGSQRDISLTKHMEETLKSAKIKLENEVITQAQKLIQAEKMAAIGQMSAMIAHDMRNPLSAVKMNMQILKQGLNDMLDVDEKTHFNIAGEQIQYLEDIISSLLTYARSDTRNKEWIELPRIVEGALIMVQRQIQENHVEVKVDWEVGLQNIYGDPLQLRQLFQNLIINAIQAMVDAPKRSCSIAGRRLMIESEDWIEVVVSDQGKGIDPNMFDSIFDPFVSGQAKGTGLGLAIVGRIVDAHGGRVDLLNGISGGARAVVMLPVMGNQAEMEAEGLEIKGKES